MALGNLKFAATNWKFCLALGGLYWLVAQLLMFSNGDVFERQGISGFAWVYEIAWSMIASPMYWVLSGLLIAALWQYTDAKGWKRKLSLAAAHGFWHAGLILILVSALPPLNTVLAQLSGLEDLIPGVLSPGAIGHAILFLAETVFVGGFVGGVIWGVYLVLVSYCGGLHSNDAFSAMRLDSHKHFLRMRIKRSELTIYPIALDNVPSRNGWKVDWPNDMNNQDKPMVVPKNPLSIHLIEGPVSIRVPEVQRIQEVAESK